MTTTKRITKADRYNQLLTIDAVKSNPELVDFINHELELLANKNKTTNGEKKLTATQKENMTFKAEILEAMEIGKKYTCGEIAKLVPSLNNASTSKVSSLLRQMRDDIPNGTGEIHRTEEKGKTYFSLA